MTSRLVFTDLRRAQKKKSFIICMSVVILLMVVVAIVAFVKPVKATDISFMLSGEPNARGYSFLSNITLAFSLIPFLTGIPVFQTVFSDDFKSRTMQTAIGRGISRRRLILARFYEAIALIIEEMVIFTILGLIMSMIMGASIGGIGKMIAELWFDSILVVADIAIAMLILYMSQNTTGGLVMYILLAANVFRAVLALLDLIPFLKNNGIKFSNAVPDGVHSIARDYLFGTVPSLSDLSEKVENFNDLGVNEVEAMFTGATEDPNYLKAFLYTGIFVGLFIVLPLVLAQTVFRKKELEF